MIKKEDFIFRINNLKFDKHCIADEKVLEDVQKLDNYNFTEKEKYDIELYIKWCKDEMIKKAELLNRIVKNYNYNLGANFDIDNLTNNINILNKVAFEINKLIK